MINVRQMLAFALLLGLSVLLTGCATMYQPLNLWYDPAVKGCQGAGRPVAVVKFTDMREDADTVVFQCNSTREVTSRWVIHDQDAGAWVANALARELEKSGYRVSRYEDAAPGDAVLTVNGILYESYIDYDEPPTRECGCLGGLIADIGSRCGAWVKTHVAMEYDGVPALNRQYVGHGQVSGGQARQGFEQALNNALQDLMKKLVPDLEAASKKGGRS